MNGSPTGPKVCVLMATHNGRHWIEEQLASILNQHGVQVDVWISDDASSDGLPQWLAERARQDGRLHVLQHGRRFGSAAGNFYYLLAHAPTQQYPYFALADQDDVWHLDKLQRHLELLESSQVDAVSSDVMAFWPSGRQVLIKKSDPQRRWDFLFEPPGPGCSFLMRASVVERCNATIAKLTAAGIELLPFHDWMIYVVARASGMRWLIDARPSLQYRQHDRNEVGAHVGWRAARIRLRSLFRGDYRRLVERAMLIAVVAAQECGHGCALSSLGPWTVLSQGRRRWRDSLIAAAFMPRGVRVRQPAGPHTAP